MSGISWAIYLAARLRLDQSFSESPVVVSGQVLITDGVFKHVRHPIYSSYLLLYFSLLLTSRGIAVALCGPYICVWMFNRIRLEELALHHVFGERYVAYKDSTGLLFPKL